MQFKRKKKRGVSRRVKKLWYSEEGYRIVWRKEVFGIAVPARYQACVKTVIPNYSGIANEPREMWDFVDAHRRLYKTQKAAEEACERHRRLWTKACEATGLRALTELFGRLPLGYPRWARTKMNRKAMAFLTRPRAAKYVEEEEECQPESSPPDGESAPSDPTDPPKTSESDTTSEAPAKTRRRGRASPATEEAKSTTRKTRRARSKATATDEPSSAKPAKAAAKEPAKRASKRTAKPSKTGAKKSKSTTGSSKRGTTRGRGSRKTKSKPPVN